MVVSSPSKAYVKRSKISGNGLFCNADVAPGDVVLCLDRPLIVALDKSHLESTCSNCLACARELSVPLGSEWINIDAVKACTSCHVLHYCSKV